MKKQEKMRLAQGEVIPGGGPLQRITAEEIKSMEAKG